MLAILYVEPNAEDVAILNNVVLPLEIVFSCCLEFLFASGQASDARDVAVLERTLPDLRTALRKRYPGAFDLLTDEPAAAPWQVIVSFHPPRGEPNPDPW